MTSFHPIAGPAAVLVLIFGLAGSAAAESLVLTNECLGDLSACTASTEGSDAPDASPTPIAVAKRGPALGSDSGPLSLSNRDLGAPPTGFDDPAPSVEAAPPVAEAPVPQPKEQVAVAPSTEAPVPDAVVAAEAPEVQPAADAPLTRTVDDIPQRLTVVDDETLAQMQTAEGSAAADSASQVADASPTAEAIPTPVGEGAEAASGGGTEAWVFPNGDGTLASTTDEGNGSQLDLGSCMERSIRAGNAYDESERVCKAVFPR